MDAPRLIEERELQRFYGKGFIKRVYELPDGTQDKFYVFSGEAPVIIFPLTEDEEVIAIRQFRYGANEFILEIPGGVIKKGATDLDTVKAELLEETGFAPSAIHEIGEAVWFEPSAYTVAFKPYLCLGCRKTEGLAPEKTEIMETVLVPWKEWVKMIFRGQVCDSKSITVTFLALAFLGCADVQGLFQQILTERRFSGAFSFY